MAGSSATSALWKCLDCDCENLERQVGCVACGKWRDGTGDVEEELAPGVDQTHVANFMHLEPVKSAKAEDKETWLTDMKELHNALRYDSIIGFDMQVARTYKLWRPHEHFNRVNANLKKTFLKRVAQKRKRDAEEQLAENDEESVGDEDLHKWTLLQAVHYCLYEALHEPKMRAGREPGPQCRLIFGDNQIDDPVQPVPKWWLA